jgi:hypothetical protein
LGFRGLGRRADLAPSPRKGVVANVHRPFGPLCIARRRHRKIARFRLCWRPPRSDTLGSVSSRAAAKRANSVGWCSGLGRGVLGSQLAPKIPSNKGFTPASRPRTIREFQVFRSSEDALLSTGGCLRSAANAGILKPAFPRKAKRSSLRQLVVSRILVQSPIQ